MVRYISFCLVCLSFFSSIASAELLYLPTTEFQMGDAFTEGDSDELPLHSVTINSFYIDMIEVTYGDYCAFLNDAVSLNIIEVRSGTVFAVDQDDPYFDTTTANPNSPISWDGNVFAVITGLESHPAAFVSWFGANAFCDLYGLRLPTEAEWECAVRGGLVASRHPWGDTVATCSYAVIDEGGGGGCGTGSTSPVGSLPLGATTDGLLDMAGNIYEWCNDWYDPNYYGISPPTNPQGPLTGSQRIIRGGSWNHTALECRVAAREGINPVLRIDTVGFRVVSSICPYKLAGDVDENCRVDIIDFSIIATNWLVDCKSDPNQPECVLFIDQDKDGAPAILDCDDNDPALNLKDVDGDGFSSCDGDCYDLDPDSYPGAVEKCDLVDNDCDGQIDEDFKDGGGRLITDENCGVCGNDCTLLNFGGQSGVCNNLVDPPICSIQCTANCFDVNANPADGCECCDPTPTDMPDPSGIDANCDGIDGELFNGIFVAKSGSDSNDGSRNSPKLTIQAGINAALSQGKRDVYVSGSYYDERLVILQDVKVYGGYSQDFKTRNITLYTTIVQTSSTTISEPGTVNCLDITSGTAASTVFDGFTILGANTSQTGASTYAVYVRNCDQTLRLTNNTIIAGLAGNGSRSMDGDDGTQGGDGGPGVDAIDLFEAYGLTDHSCIAAYHLSGGQGGLNSCGPIDTHGGTGGNRECPYFDGNTTDSPSSVESGQNGLGEFGGGTGGQAGQDVFHQASICNGYMTYSSLIGEDGSPGSEGNFGDYGQGVMDPVGTITSGIWSPPTAENGLDGKAGSGGGGGGSGAGAWMDASCYAKGFGYDNIGATGGGGGAGGCSGIGGTGGSSGGSSFAIFVVFDITPATAPMISDNTLQGGTGGAGGNGGSGGQGGQGGLGGVGGSGEGTYAPPDPVYPSFDAGNGGDGGLGGHGGGGGGGAGGCSYGIFVHNSGPVNLDSYIINNNYLPGTGGQGGEGGFSLGNPGTDGSTGIVANTNF